MRRITRAIVTRIALCKRGKTGLETLFKSADGPEELKLNTLVRKSEVEGSLLAVVYAPSDEPDDDGHIADDIKVIERSAHEFLRDHRELDIEHDGKVLPPEAAYVAESFIIGQGDQRFQDWRNYDGEPVDVTGGWAVRIQIDDPEIRAAFADGDWDGVSMFGLAATEPVEKSKSASQRVLDRLTRSGEPQGESDMDETKLAEMFKSLGDRLVESISKAVATPTAPTSDPAAIVAAANKATQDAAEAKAKAESEADPVQAQIDALTKPAVPKDVTSPSAMTAFGVAQRQYEMQVKQIKGELSADDVTEMVKSMATSVPSDKDCGIETEDTPRERELKRELFEMAKSRNAPEGDERKTADEELEAVQKSRSLLAGRISAAYNESVGAGGSTRSHRTVKAEA